MSCNNTQCHICTLRNAIEVVGDDIAIKREFERIEQAERRTLNIDAQTKTPSAVTDGV